MVIAETLEAATEGARLLAPTYETETPRIGLDAGDVFTPDAVGVGAPPAESDGDVEAGLAAASSTIAATYETPAQYHNAMEPHAALAQWDGDRLTLHMPTQGLAISQGRLAGLFGIRPDDIQIESPYLGGGFGSKGVPSGPQVLACMAARWSGGRSSSCRHGRRCTARWAIAARPGRRCGSAPTRPASSRLWTTTS